MRHCILIALALSCQGADLGLPNVKPQDRVLRCFTTPDLSQDKVVSATLPADWKFVDGCFDGKRNTAFLLLEKATGEHRIRVVRDGKTYDVEVPRCDFVSLPYRRSARYLVVTSTRVREVGESGRVADDEYDGKEYEISPSWELRLLRTEPKGGMMTFSSELDADLDRRAAKYANEELWYATFWNRANSAEDHGIFVTAVPWPRHPIAWSEDWSVVIAKWVSLSVIRHPATRRYPLPTPGELGYPREAMNFPINAHVETDGSVMTVETVLNASQIAIEVVTFKHDDYRKSFRRQPANSAYLPPMREYR